MESVESLDEPVTLPGEWPNLLERGQIFTALLLSTSYSEKYRGRNMVPCGSALEAAERESRSSFDHTAELQIPSNDRHETRRPALLHRSGNREAVAFIWRGDLNFNDHTIYVCFSPLRYRTQFLKIWCAGLAENGIRRSAQHTSDLTFGTRDLGQSVTVPVSTYLKVKLDRLWDINGQKLYHNLLQTVTELPGYRVIFSGISHGAALAQAAALKFQLQQPETQVFVVAWNAYRWTDGSGRKLAEELLADRLLHFVLSRRDKAQPQATRYWDSVTGFPREFSPMPNPVLLDADTGDFYKHTAPEQGSQFGATALMQMFELHFARSALSAMKKATARASGTDDVLGALLWEEYVLSRRLEVLQDKIIDQAQKVATASRKAKDIMRRTSHGVTMRRQISPASEAEASSSTLETPRLELLRERFRHLRGASCSSAPVVQNGQDALHDTHDPSPRRKSWLIRWLWCC